MPGLVASGTHCSSEALGVNSIIDRLYGYCPGNESVLQQYTQAYTPTQCLQMAAMTFFAPHWRRCFLIPNKILLWPI